MIAVGTIATLISRAHFFGLGVWSRAKVLAATHYPEVHVVEAELLVNKRWPGHKPGQFAFVTTDWKEGVHPFTIATA